MQKKQHKIDIHIQKEKNNIFLKLKMNGKLTHKDYQDALPLIEKKYQRDK
jgi:hypothetical protein